MAVTGRKMIISFARDKRENALIFSEKFHAFFKKDFAIVRSPRFVHLSTSLFVFFALQLCIFRVFIYVHSRAISFSSKSQEEAARLLFSGVFCLPSLLEQNLSA